MKILCLSVFLFLTVWNLSAVEPSPDVVPLDSLIEEALRKNPEILAAQKRVESSRQRPSQESSLPDPTFSLGYTSNGNPLPGAGLGREPTSNVGFMVTQQFLYPGKRKLKGDIASREADAEWQQYRATQLSVVSRLKQAFFRLHHTYEAMEILEQNREALRDFLKVSEIRYSVGRAQQQDIFKVQTQLTLLDAQMQRQELERGSREAEINSLLNRPPGASLGRPEEIPVHPVPATLEEVYGSAEQNSPALLREQKMIARNELAVNLARKDYYPNYAVSGGYFNQGGMPDMYQVRVDVELPAWFWRKQRAGVAERGHDLGQARRNFEAVDQSLHFRIKSEYLLAETSYRLSRLYSETAVPQAHLALESSMASYETGSIDALSVISNLMNVLENEMSYHEEMLNFHLALTRLEEMSGMALIHH